MPTKTTAHSSLLELFGSHSARVFMSGKVLSFWHPTKYLTHTAIYFVCESSPQWNLKFIKDRDHDDLQSPQNATQL